MLSLMNHKNIQTKFKFQQIKHLKKSKEEKHGQNPPV